MMTLMMMMKKKKSQLRRKRRLRKKRRQKRRKLKVLSKMRLLNARTAEMNLFSPLESKSFTLKKDSTTNLSDVKSVKMPRNPVWRADKVVAEEDVVVETLEEEVEEVR
jgi:hypothetical protein